MEMSDNISTKEKESHTYKQPYEERNMASEKPKGKTGKWIIKKKIFLK